MTFVADKEWAEKLCNGWNWNANAAEIAHDLIEMGITLDGYQWGVFQREFLKFFPDNGERDWETIRQIVEVFGE